MRTGVSLDSLGGVLLSLISLPRDISSRSSPQTSECPPAVIGTNVPGAKPRERKEKSGIWKFPIAIAECAVRLLPVSP